MKKLSLKGTFSAVLLVSVVSLVSSLGTTAALADSGTVRLNVELGENVFKAPHLSDLVIPHPEKLNPDSPEEIQPNVGYGKAPTPKQLQPVLFNGYTDGLELEKRLLCPGLRPTKADGFQAHMDAILAGLTKVQATSDNLSRILPALVYIDGLNMGMLHSAQNYFLCQGTPDA